MAICNVKPASGHNATLDHLNACLLPTCCCADGETLSLSLQVFNAICPFGDWRGQAGISMIHHRAIRGACKYDVCMGGVPRKQMIMLRIA